MRFIRELFFIFIVALFFAGLTAGVHSSLSKRIELNNRTRETRQLLDVLNIPVPKSADASQVAEIRQQRVSKADVDGHEIFRACDKHGKVTGYAFHVEGKGFWGGMRGLLELSADLDTIEGIVFTQHNETPGLGARVDEPWFRDQFKGLKLSNAGKGHKYITISLGSKSAPNHVEAITGATMTSNAVQRFLNDDLKRIVAMKDQVRRAEWPSPQER